jgi:cytochrome b subunit of formate dehydrogenase
MTWSGRVIGSLIATAITVGLTWVVEYFLVLPSLLETWPQFWSYVAAYGIRVFDLQFELLFWSLAFDLLITLIVIYGSYWVLGHFAVYAANYQRYRQLMDTPKVQRWSVMQRVQHIAMFVTLVLTAFTGFVTMFANNPQWHQWYIPGVYNAAASPPYFLWPAQTGPVQWMIIIHVWSGIAMGVLVIAHFAYYGTRVLIDIIRRRPVMERWPLLRLWTWGFVKYLVHRSIWLVKPSWKVPQWVHKYDAEQLFEYWGVYWGIVILGIPGVLMAIYGPSAFDGLAFLFHTKEAVLAVSFLLLVHLTYTHFMPHIFPYNRMFHEGKIPSGIAREEHPLWSIQTSQTQ